MTKIHSHINDPETPEIVKDLLKGFVYEFNNQISDSWRNQVTNNDSEYHRKILLKQGRCDFDNPSNGLTSEELICLYNYYYFAMHFQSSFWLYNYIWNSGFAMMFIINKAPIFIDLGCGSLASSIAFAQTINQQININLFTKEPMLTETGIKVIPPISLDSFFDDLSKQGATYLFSDISNKILDYTYDFVFTNKHLIIENNKNISKHIMYTKNIWKTIWLSDGHFADNFPFDTFYLFNGINNNEYKQKEYKHPNDYEDIGDFVEDIKNGCKNEPSKLPKNISTILNNNNNNPIIINCCYLFASNSINIDQVAEFVNTIIESHKENICLIYQNPDTQGLNNNWEAFKLKVKLKSILKGVELIKHYGNSKVRYEVLFKSKFGY